MNAMMTELTELGHAYLLADDVSNEAQYKTVGEVLGRFFLAQATPIARALDVMYVPESEPYATPEEMLEAFAQGAVMIAATAPGTTPLWGVDENNSFRLWHDYSHHFLLGLSFSLEPEYQAYLAAVVAFYEWASTHGYDAETIATGAKILFNEMVLQPCAAVWLGGYDASRYGLTFSQKITNITHLPSSVEL